MHAGETRDVDAEAREPWPLAFELRGDRSATAPWTVRSVDGVATLQGERIWLLRDTAEVVAAVAGALAGFATQLANDLIEIRFGNAVGRFALGTLDDRSLGVIDVHSGKWTGAHFEAMLADIVRTAATLPFAGARGGALPYDRRHSGDAETLYQRFVYVRHIVLGHGPPSTRLMPAIASIVADPHRRWRQSRQVVPPALARDVDVGALTAAVSGRHGFDRAVTRDGAASRAIVRALRGFVPTAITEITRTPTVDTPENRFVKAFLHELDRIAADVIRHASQSSDRWDNRRSPWLTRVAAEAREVRYILGRELRGSLWADVGPQHHPPFGSTVLQRRRGYRDVLGHAARLRLTAHLPLADAAAERLLEGKDIATLYELWCFFRVADAVRAILGEPAAALGFEQTWRALDVPHDGRIAWRSGVELLYNARFPGDGGSGRAVDPQFGRARTSYSVGLRPDITLSVPAGPNAGLHLLDAKFRVSRETAGWLTSVHAVDDEADLSAGTFLNDDLYKMHAYRDAIPAARSVWVLYPGGSDVVRFFRAPAQVPEPLTITDGPSPTNAGTDGVGAIPLRPVADGGAEDGSGLRDLMGQLLGTAVTGRIASLALTEVEDPRTSVTRA